MNKFAIVRQSPRRAAAVVSAVAAASAAAPALAAPPDLTSLTTAIDFSTAGTAVLAAAGALIVVYITIKASGFVIGMIKRG